jgi:4-hydroxy-tetrahydrodipicolinate reductase
MNIAIIGYGKMGRAIEQVALRRGHTVAAVIDAANTCDFGSEAFRSADVAIEFTTPGMAVDNYRQCFAAGIPVVSGTTGWLDRWDEVKQACEAGNHAFFYASNFSVGVNILFAVNKYLARIMDRLPSYEASITEIHHTHKLDAPSGTAITLADGITANLARKTGWQAEGKALSPSDLAICSIREGEVPGTHEVVYESPVDLILIRHEAKSREGFALGAVMAAEFTAGKKGILGMDDMLPY